MSDISEIRAGGQKGVNTPTLLRLPLLFGLASLCLVLSLALLQLLLQALLRCRQGGNPLLSHCPLCSLGCNFLKPQQMIEVMPSSLAAIS